MSLPHSSNSPLPLEIETRRTELADLVMRHVPSEGVHTTGISKLDLIRGDQPTEHSTPALYEPCLCLIAQGRKQACLGEEIYFYDPLHYLIASVSLPISGRVIEASPQEPYLCVRLSLDLAQITELIAETGIPQPPRSQSSRGLFVERVDSSLLDAMSRLLRLLETPADAPTLAPLIIREIYYRLLRSPQGARLQEIAIVDSQAHRIARAIEWLNQHYHKPLRIDDLAQVVNLSSSTLHHRFKSVTAMSPLQYQKQLRLQEARRLMITEGLDASAAGYRVGYESASQFSREYSRQFGAPPLRDLARLRTSA
ncbi:AraC family transcriptional regulator [Pseudomonas kuykendallii]|uniref:AraC family transcriptional regulator n=1 Tax=Pseudomonas kuykendallii TaxID=1007099 RepID=UPI0028D2F0F8|nr:AraC family transcriptional regulator [Pseudomonas kuykendallii]